MKGRGFWKVDFRGSRLFRNHNPLYFHYQAGSDKVICLN